jgi:hypothetical protein
MVSEDIVYYLSIEDLQAVANQEIDRDLTQCEIEKIKDIFPEKIAWYNAIADSIPEVTRETTSKP